MCSFRKAVTMATCHVQPRSVRHQALAGLAPVGLRRQQLLMENKFQTASEIKLGF